MTMLAAKAPRLASRQGAPPVFLITDEPGRWVCLEVAINPLFLERPGNLSDPRVAWASWLNGLLPPGQISLPDNIWLALRESEKLYYRAHSSSSLNAWTDHAVTYYDDQIAEAPYLRLCDTWLIPSDDISLQENLSILLDRVSEHPDFGHFDLGQQHAVLVCLHRFSPRKPTTANLLNWVVVLVCEGVNSDKVQFLVLRMAVDSLAYIAADYGEAPGMLFEAAIPSLNPLPQEVDAKVQSWPHSLLGPFLVFRENSPAPDDEGGTCIVVPSLQRCLFLASCRWSASSDTAAVLVGP